jgi:hypothetical protein
MEMDLTRKLRHDLRGRWHALSLCMTALDLSEDAYEKVEMLDLLAQSADEIDSVLQQMEALPDV